ncbi:hypothetical protein [Pikeienuella sp. HZG-20]|uniref:hypothetical protein n=1 Tax=Paludibacillus litoralis TaxID=3133267 RepID=UPI0030ED14FA
MVRDFGLKLKVTILALGFATKKELHRHFLTVAPTLGLEQDSLYKWIQGRSTPRSSKVYEHWAGMLRLDRSLAHLKSCSIEEFADDVIKAYGLDPAMVTTVAPLGARPGAADPDPADAPRAARDDHLCGTFACYSRAFSPIFAGKIVRGILIIGPSSGASRIKARYTETTPFTELIHRGRVSPMNGLITLDLHDDRHDSHVHLILHAPRTPASVLAGLMAGLSFHDASPRPSVTRFLAIRAPGIDLSALGGRECVFDEADHSIAEELIRSGLPIVDAVKFDRIVFDFLAGEGQGGFDHIPVDASARLNFALDLELANAEAQSARKDARSADSAVVLPLHTPTKRNI